jgi:hypothetical protein
MSFRRRVERPRGEREANPDITRRLIEELNYIQAILSVLLERQEVRPSKNMLREILTSIENLIRDINKELQNNVQFSIPENLRNKDINDLIGSLGEKFGTVIDLAHRVFGSGKITISIQTLFNSLQEIFPNLRIERQSRIER